RSDRWPRCRPAPPPVRHTGRLPSVLAVRSHPAMIVRANPLWPLSRFLNPREVNASIAALTRSYRADLAQIPHCPDVDPHRRPDRAQGPIELRSESDFETAEILPHPTGRDRP